MGVYEEVARLIKKSEGNAVALTGAGISADSGIPTFRGKDGLWRKYSPQELATPEAFERDPELVWEWYEWRISLIKKADPNPAHLALAEMERLGYLRCVVTQNVDDLHERACTKCLVKLHGDIMTAKCTRCGFEVKWKEVPKGVPKCPLCCSPMRPAVVWFGEPLPMEALIKAEELFSSAKVALVIGTSAVVQPAGSLPLLTKENGGYIIEINPDETALTPFADVVIREKASVALSKILESLLGETE
ncbi:NAD-dependent protein deacylase [Ignicoccus pacificus DSM 13166]|uniref:NAD-dependent protein deacylase n=1 Tax=Ignicoccus pacificus DSM 13166 TaxID=940294 RepID=A0A977KA01_9CREN|nr:NAD-dependent protein deacylase [Ignicoccus pacificus DSM 13166]